jgi:NADH dehydrogenase/NADH:ubiquinone oxidoreductase subunit G
LAGTNVEMARTIPSSTVIHCKTMSNVLYEVKDEKIENNENTKEQKTKRRLIMVLADTFFSIKSTRDKLLPPFIIFFYL